MSTEHTDRTNQSTQKIELKKLHTLPVSLTLDKKYDVLVLSGGGKKGITQLGFLHNLHTEYIIDVNNLHAYVGTSAGSMICFLMVIGYLPVEILTHICSSKIDSNISLNFLNLVSNFGVHSSDTIFDIIEKLTMDKIGFLPTMSELYELTQKHLVCVTHNLSANVLENEEETVYIDHISHPNLPCIEALKMSSNIPLVFGKYVYDKNYYVDGGITDNYPISYTYSKFPNKNILAIYVDNPPRVIKDNTRVSIVDYMLNLLCISLRMNSAKSCRFAKNNIHSIMMILNEGNNILDVSQSTSFQLFSIGYKCAKELISNKKLKVD